MYINRDERVSTWAAEDYILNECYIYDRKRLTGSMVSQLVDHYFDNVNDEEFVNVEEFTDWIHDLTDEEIEKITK